MMTLAACVPIVSILTLPFRNALVGEVCCGLYLDYGAHVDTCASLDDALISVMIVLIIVLLGISYLVHLDTDCSFLVWYWRLSLSAFCLYLKYLLMLPRDDRRHFSFYKSCRCRLLVYFFVAYKHRSSVLVDHQRVDIRVTLVFSCYTMFCIVCLLISYRCLSRGCWCLINSFLDQFASTRIEST